MMKNVAELFKKIIKIFEIIMDGRLKPMLMALFKNIQNSVLKHSLLIAGTRSLHRSATTQVIQRPSSKRLVKVIKWIAHLINVFKKSILYVGQEMIVLPKGPRFFKQLIDKACIFVTTILLNLKVFDELNDKSLHMRGMHRSTYVNMIMQKADLITALNVQFDDWMIDSIAEFVSQTRIAAFEKKNGIIHFDILFKNINKIVIIIEIVENDVVTNFDLLFLHVDFKLSRSEWFFQIFDWKSRFFFNYEKQSFNDLIKSQAVIERFNDLITNKKHHIIIIIKIKQHQMWIT